jgi:hypothetical protein
LPKTGIRTEAVILIAIFAGLAIAAGAIIVAKATIFIYQQRSPPEPPQSCRDFADDKGLWAPAGPNDRSHWVGRHRF